MSWLIDAIEREAINQATLRRIPDERSTERWWRQDQKQRFWWAAAAAAYSRYTAVRIGGRP